MKSIPLNVGKARATEPTLRVDKVRHAVNATRLIHQENAQHGARNVISVVIKTISVLVVGQSRKALRTVRDHLMAGAQQDALRIGADSPRRDPEADPTPEVPIVLSWTHFKTILSSMGRLSSNVHERLPYDLHGRHSFQDPEQSPNFLLKTFHTIYRSKSVLSISNETYPDGKTKILTILKIKLPHWNGIDNMRVKVDDGTEANILPLDYFRTMFPHALDRHRYPKTGFLDRSMINLECYNNGRLINHGCIKLKLQHYSKKSFQDDIFYVVETKTQKEIIVGHPASDRLGLICVLCENVSKSISAIENSENTSSSNSFQDHWLNIDGKPWQRKQRSKSESFRDHSLEHLSGPWPKCTI